MEVATVATCLCDAKLRQSKCPCPRNLCLSQLWDNHLACACWHWIHTWSAVGVINGYNHGENLYKLRCNPYNHGDVVLCPIIYNWNCIETIFTSENMATSLWVLQEFVFFTTFYSSLYWKSTKTYPHTSNVQLIHEKWDRWRRPPLHRRDANV